jgi:flotillin
LEALALSEAVAMKGDAEAFSVEVKAKAQATEMSMKADAWKDYQRAAKVAMWLEAIPKCAAEIAAPLSQVGRVTMVGYSDGPDATLGPAKMTGEVLLIMEKLPEAIENMTGHKIKMV